MRKEIILFIVMVITFCVFPCSQAEEWKITSLDWEPYSSSTMASQGNIIQKLRNLLKTEGIDLIVEFYPWKRSKFLAKKEGYVGYFPAWPEEVDPCCFFASPPIGLSEIAVMKKSDASIEFTTLDELFKTGKVGLVSTYVYPQEIVTAAQKYPNHVDETPDERSLLLKLFKGRFNVAITDPDVMMFMAEKEGIGNISKLATITQKSLVIAFSNGAENKIKAELLEKILKKQ